MTHFKSSQRFSICMKCLPPNFPLLPPPLPPLKPHNNNNYSSYTLKFYQQLATSSIAVATDSIVVATYFEVATTTKFVATIIEEVAITLVGLAATSEFVGFAAKILQDFNAHFLHKIFTAKT